MRLKCKCKEIRMRFQKCFSPVLIFETNNKQHDHVSKFYAAVLYHLILEKRGFKTDQFCICFSLQLVIITQTFLRFCLLLHTKLSTFNLYTPIITPQTEYLCQTALIITKINYITCSLHRNLQNIQIQILQIFVLILFNDSATNNLRRLLD